MHASLLPAFTQVHSLRGLCARGDGGAVAFWSVRPSLEANAYLSELLLQDLATRSLTPLTQLVGLPTQAVFTDEATLSYAIGGSVWDLPAGGAPGLRVELPWPISSLGYTPASDWLLASYTPRPADRDPYITKDLPFKRDGQGRILGPARTVAVDRQGGWHRLDTEGGVWACEISPDRRQIAYLTRPAGSLEYWDAVVEICAWDDENGKFAGTPHQLDLPRAPMALRWSSDGLLAVLAFPEVIGAPTPTELWAGRPLEGMRKWGEDTELCLGVTGAGDTTLGAQRATLQWLTGTSLLVLERRGGSISPAVIDASGARSWLGGEHLVIDEACVCPGTGRVVGIYETPTHLQELADLTPETTTALTELNPWTFPAPERFAVRGALGEEVSACALWANERAEAAPTVLVIHGGPHGAFGDSVYYQHHLMARAGMNVVWANPHGSMGYGIEFARSLVGHWGELDSLDWAAVVEELRRRGRAPQPLAVWGASYGGFMSIWLAGHWPDVRAAVVQAPVADQWGMYAASDIGYAFTSYGCGLGFGAGPTSQDEVDRRHDLMWRNSPLRTYQAIEAAVLLLHGAGDDRCPLHHSEELYTLLKYAGKSAVEFVVYPGESHLMTTSGMPRMRDDRYRRIRDWLTRHLLLDQPTS